MSGVLYRLTFAIRYHWSLAGTTLPSARWKSLAVDPQLPASASRDPELLGSSRARFSE
jgi:hypothetical protein